MTPAQAYAVASQYGSYINSIDPGRCFYSFYVNDARPGSEAHRQDCIAYAEEQLSRVRVQIAWAGGESVAHDAELREQKAELEELVAFFRTCELHPLADVDEAA